MRELYELVIAEAKKAILQDKKLHSGTVGFFEETHLLIREAIDLHRCILEEIVPETKSNT